MIQLYILRVEDEVFDVTGIPCLIEYVAISNNTGAAALVCHCFNLRGTYQQRLSHAMLVSIATLMNASFKYVISSFGFCTIYTLLELRNIKEIYYYVLGAHFLPASQGCRPGFQGSSPTSSLHHSNNAVKFDLRC